VKRIALFAYHFVVGDDWRIAAAVVVALALTGLTGQWWVLPAAVAVILPVSLWRAAPRVRR
jgi:hypothetical protein